MTDYVDDALVESLWQDLEGQVSRQRIVRAATEIAARFDSATVMAFVPVFIRRQVLERLGSESSSESRPEASSASMDGSE